jgi:predicted secreted protein
LEAIQVIDTMSVIARPWRWKVVKRTSSSERAQSWVVDYSAARARAIEWLGDRYLLARPVNASENGWRKRTRTLIHASPASSEERAS